MSRVRTRPSRDDTRGKLFRAAADLFERRGIGGTTIDAITAAADLTRGAFYSNFAGKDELVIAMLEDHAERSRAFHRAAIARHDTPADLIAALRTADRDDDPLGRSPLLHIELILYVARCERRRPELAERLRARRRLIAELVSATLGDAADVDADSAGALLVALEDGFRLHWLIDPATTPADSFFPAVAWLERLVRTHSGR